MYAPKLFKGARVAIVGPSSSVTEERLAEGVAAIKRLGFEPVVYESARSMHGYFAGTDAVRAADINAAFADKSIDGIIATRGGYGGHRVLPLLDYDTIAKNPKFFGGYSDITAYHIALNQRCGFATYHMPMACALYAPDAYSLACAETMLFGTPANYENPEGYPRETLVPGTAEGVLCGGNLSLIAASLGTPWEIDTRGKILFFEDVDERPYRIDSMLTHLRNAGKFADCAGILIGDFSDCDPKPEEKTLSLDALIDEIVKPVGKPTIKGVRCGHCTPTMSLPLGKRFRMDADACTFGEAE